MRVINLSTAEPAKVQLVAGRSPRLHASKPAVGDALREAAQLRPVPKMFGGAAQDVRPQHLAMDRRMCPPPPPGLPPLPTCPPPGLSLPSMAQAPYLTGSESTAKGKLAIEFCHTTSSPAPSACETAIASDLEPLSASSSEAGDEAVAEIRNDEGSWRQLQLHRLPGQPHTGTREQQLHCPLGQPRTDTRAGLPAVCRAATVSGPPGVFFRRSTVAPR